MIIQYATACILFISANGLSDTSLHDFDHYDQPLLLLLVLQPVV